MRSFAIWTWLLGAVLIVGSNSSLLWAQSGFLVREDRGNVSLEMYFPSFKGEGKTEFPTSTTVLAADVPLSKTVRIIADLPFSYFKNEVKYSGGTEIETENAPGNPLLGLRFISGRQHWLGDLAVRIPVMPEDKMAAAIVGIYSDIERWEAFLQDWTTILFRTAYQNRYSNGFTVGGQLGYSLLVNSGNENADDTEGFFIYGLQVGLVQPTFRLNMEFFGRYLATKEEGNFGQRSYHQLKISTYFGWGKIWPGVILKVPLDQDFRDILNSVFGVQVKFLL